MITFNEYKEQALRSIKPHDSKDTATLDWALGIGGELGEVLELFMSSANNKMTYAKEIGDVIWYCTALSNELNFTVNYFSCEPSGDIEPITIIMNRALIAGSKVQEAVKHYVFHKEQKALDNIKDELVMLMLYLTALCSKMDLNIQLCAELNAAKLSHRYNLKRGGAYSHSASANRHAKEEKFEDTQAYKDLVYKILKVEV